MRFGKTLQASIYPPWRDHYIDYTKLKQLLREVSDSDDSPTGTPQTEPAQHEWTEHDESRFVHELINVQLEKVHSFQLSMNNALDERTSHCEQRLEKLVAANQGDEADFTPEQKAKVLKQTLAELDTVTKEINELERFSRINFTGFLKAAKKHDRRSRAGNAGKGKAKAVGDPKVKPLLQVRLSHLEFNKEDYSPLLYRYVSLIERYGIALIGGKSVDHLRFRAAHDERGSARGRRYTPWGPCPGPQVHVAQILGPPR